jgi:hypothetical protein
VPASGGSQAGIVRVVAQPLLDGSWMQRRARRPLAKLAVRGGLAVSLLCVPRGAMAQDLTSVMVSARGAIDRAASQAQAETLPIPPRPITSVGHVSFVMQSLYASTAVVQGLDAQSTFKALSVGAVESNSLVKPFAANRPAFIALKAAMATAFIYAGHDLAKRHKVGAILALGLVNSLYTAIALHNYHVVHLMDERR